jgi:uncharacterized membrane protein
MMSDPRERTFVVEQNFVVDGADPRGPGGSPVGVVETARGEALPHACAPEAPAAADGSPVDAGSEGRTHSRLIGIDAARGLALVGMMAVHNIDATTANGQVSLAWSLASGKSAALFALLAGLGLAFASGGRRRPRGRTWRAQSASLLVRALIIGTVGLLLGYVVPTDDAAVILPYYAVLFVFAVPLLPLSIRALVAVAATITVAMPVLSHLLRSGTELVTMRNPTFTDLLNHPLQLLSELVLTGTFPALPWMAYLCAGLAVGRALLSSRLTLVLTTLIGVALVAAARLTSWVLLDVLGGRPDLEQAAVRSMTPAELTSLLQVGPTGVTPSDTAWWLATMAPHSSTPLDIANTIGVALAILGIALLIGRATTALLRPLAAAGSMSLTLYCGHLLMLSYPAMPGGPTGLVIQVAVVVAFALIWSHFRPRGPLEDVVARATGAVRRRVMRSGPPGGAAAPAASGVAAGTTALASPENDRERTNVARPGSTSSRKRTRSSGGRG